MAEVSRPHSPLRWLSGCDCTLCLWLAAVNCSNCLPTSAGRICVVKPISSVFLTPRPMHSLNLLLAELSAVLCIWLAGASLCSTSLMVAIAVEMSTAMELPVRCDIFMSLLLSRRLSTACRAHSKEQASTKDCSFLSQECQSKDVFYVLQRWGVCAGETSVFQQGRLSQSCQGRETAECNYGQYKWQIFLCPWQRSGIHKWVSIKSIARTGRKHLWAVHACISIVVYTTWKLYVQLEVKFDVFGLHCKLFWAKCHISI